MHQNVGQHHLNNRIYHFDLRLHIPTHSHQPLKDKILNELIKRFDLNFNKLHSSHQFNIFNEPFLSGILDLDIFTSELSSRKFLNDHLVQLHVQSEPFHVKMEYFYEDHYDRLSSYSDYATVYTFLVLTCNLV